MIAIFWAYFAGSWHGYGKQDIDSLWACMNMARNLREPFYIEWHTAEEVR